MSMIAGLPPESVGLRLARIIKDELLLCEAVRFVSGVAGVDIVLRRAAISGRVEIDGKIENHFADVLDANGDIVETIALDRHSYSVLKNRWMRCKVERFDRPRPPSKRQIMAMPKRKKSPPQVC
jgi:hypothetical protein